MKIKEIVSVAILISLAVVLSIIESFIPMSIPGVKIGLANVITLIALYKYGIKESVLVQLLRIFLVGLIYSGILSISFLLSLSGGILSLVVMILLYKLTKLSLMTISVLGSISHAVGQILMSYVFVLNNSVFYYMIITIALSIICGILTATLCFYTLRAFKIKTILFSKVELISSLSLFIILLSLSIVFNNVKKKDSEGSVATITYQNHKLMTINLSDPNEYVNYSNMIITTEEVDGSYLFTFDVYNMDEKDYFILVLEVKEEGIRIKEETCKKHICSNRGFIYSKYESIVCLPNNFVVTIDNLDLGDIDAML